MIIARQLILKGDITMKKILISCVVVLLLTLAACQSGKTYTYAQPISNVEKIIIVSEEMQKEVSLSLFEELKGLTCERYWNDPCQDIGETYIKILYKDGSQECIGASANFYEKNGKKDFGWEYFDPSAFSDLLREYMR